MNWEPVIGLEVHVELSTKSKMFCRCSADYFGKEPNTHTCPVCLGLPGALPYTNQKAIEDCIKIGLALNCQIESRDSLFERKNYFYPDLPKGYQISQYRWPLCTEGFIEVTAKSGKKKRIRINRVHQEEDTGKLSHQGNLTLVDFNRSGVPLVEIVTEPDFEDVEQVKDYAKQLQNIFRSLGVSNADMEKGDMRLEANVSVRKRGETHLPNYRIELKNINSFRFIASAVEYDIKRQTELLEKGESLKQETRGWNEDKKQTFAQRSKEEANDYRYFPEPDIPALSTPSEKVSKIRAQIPQLPKQKEDQFQKMGMTASSAATIAASIVKTAVFEQASALVTQEEKGGLGNFFANSSFTLKDPGQLEDYAKDLVKRFNEAKSAKSQIISDKESLAKFIEEALNENEKSAQDYKAGKTNAIQALVGAVMRKSKGLADAKQVMILLEEKLK